MLTEQLFSASDFLPSESLALCLCLWRIRDRYLFDFFLKPEQLFFIKMIWRYSSCFRAFTC